MDFRDMTLGAAAMYGVTNLILTYYLGYNGLRPVGNEERLMRHSFALFGIFYEFGSLWRVPKAFSY